MSQATISADLRTLETLARKPNLVVSKTVVATETKRRKTNHGKVGGTHFGFVAMLRHIPQEGKDTLNDGSIDFGDLVKNLCRW